MELNPTEDAKINVADLTSEFKLLPLLVFRYSEIKAEAGHAADIEEAKYKEARAEVFKACLTNYDKKPSDKVLDAEIESHPDVVAQKRRMIDAKRDFETIKGYLESIKAKKDMLIQLGADARKE